MEPEAFKYAMPSYQVAMWEDYAIEKFVQEGRTGDSFEYYMMVPEDQKVILTVDYGSPRLLTASCPNPKWYFNYNLYVNDNNGDQIAHEAISSQHGYGHAIMDLKAGEYPIKVMNW